MLVCETCETCESCETCETCETCESCECDDVSHVSVMVSSEQMHYIPKSLFSIKQLFRMEHVRKASWKMKRTL